MFLRKRKKTKGQAIVEMAIVFPFFLLIIVGGIIDFGFAFYNYISLQQIANDTAQWATDNYQASSVTTAMISQHATGRKPAWWKGNFTVTPKISQLPTGEKTVEVFLSYESPTYTPFYQTMFRAASGNSSIKLTSKAVYKIPEFVITR